MTIEEFTLWCAYFREELLNDEDDAFLKDWFGNLKSFGLSEAKDAVASCVKNSPTLVGVVPKDLLPTIIRFCQDRVRGPFTRRYEFHDDGLFGDAWKNSPLRKELLKRIRANKKMKKAEAKERTVSQ